jgi:predicted NBD/HSP70 family sugar kinase
MLEEVIVIEYAGHLGDCAVREDGPCTCGTDEVLEELALEEAGLTAEDFE